METQQKKQVDFLIQKLCSQDPEFNDYYTTFLKTFPYRTQEEMLFSSQVVSNPQYKDLEKRLSNFRCIFKVTSSFPSIIYLVVQLWQVKPSDSLIEFIQYCGDKASDQIRTLIKHNFDVQEQNYEINESHLTTLQMILYILATLDKFIGINVARSQEYLQELALAGEAFIQQIKQCYTILSDYLYTRQQICEEMIKARERLLQKLPGIKISRTIGSSTTIAGTALMPFTAGLSLIAAGVGAVISFSSQIAYNQVMKKNQNSFASQENEWAIQREFDESMNELNRRQSILQYLGKDRIQLLIKNNQEEQLKSQQYQSSSVFQKCMNIGFKQSSIFSNDASRLLNAISNLSPILQIPLNFYELVSNWQSRSEEIVKINLMILEYEKETQSLRRIQIFMEDWI